MSQERGPKFSNGENCALVAAVIKEKHILFSISASALEKSDAWARVADSVNAVGGAAYRTINCVKHRYYDCKAAVRKRMALQRRGSHPGEMKFNEWQAQLRDENNPEAVSGVNSFPGPSTASAGRSVSTSSSHRRSGQRGHSTMARGSVQLHSPALSAVLLSDGSPDIAMEKSPVSSEDDIGHGACVDFGPQDAVLHEPEMPVQPEPTPAAEAFHPGTSTRTTDELLRRLLKETRRLTRAVNNMSRQFATNLARLSMEQRQAIEQSTQNIIEAIHANHVDGQSLGSVSLDTSSDS